MQHVQSPLQQLHFISATISTVVFDSTDCYMMQSATC